MRAVPIAGAILLSTVAGCSPGRTYELRGQVLAVDASRQEITVKHDDIRGFMPGMTMPFRVPDASAFRERKPGELIRATLVVEDTSAYLTKITNVGHAAITEPLPRTTAMLNAGDAVPDASFVDERGAARRLSEWRGRGVAVTFIYTRCPIPDFCPLMDRHFAAVQKVVLADAALKDRVRLLSVSFDPAFDTPEILSAHARRLGADPSIWTFLTGAPEEIERFASAFGISVTRSDPTDIMHNLRTAVIAGDGTLVKVFGGNEWKPEELLSSLRDLGAVR